MDETTLVVKECIFGDDFCHIFPWVDVVCQASLTNIYSQKCFFNKKVLTLTYCNYRNKTVQRSNSGSKELWECSWWWWCRCWCGSGAPTVLPSLAPIVPVMVLPAIAGWDSTRQEQVLLLPCNWGKICPWTSQPLTYPSRCHPPRGSRHWNLGGLVLRGGLGTLWGVFLLCSFTESMTSALL